MNTWLAVFVSVLNAYPQTAVFVLYVVLLVAVGIIAYIIESKLTVVVSCNLAVI